MNTEKRQNQRDQRIQWKRRIKNINKLIIWCEKLDRDFNWVSPEQKQNLYQQILQKIKIFEDKSTKVPSGLNYLRQKYFPHNILPVNLQQANLEQFYPNNIRDQFKPEDIEQICTNQSLIIRNCRVYSRCQAYQQVVSRLTFDINKLYFTELSHMICSFLNSKNGGEIVLVNKLNVDVVKQGLQKIYWEDIEKYRSNIEKCLKLVRCREQTNHYNGLGSIKITLMVQPIYESILQYKYDRFNQIALKIVIELDRKFASLLNKPMFYLYHKLMKNIPPNFQFCTLQTQQLSSGCFITSYRKIHGSQVYNLMMKIARSERRQQIKKKQRVRKGQKLKGEDQRVEVDLKHVQKQVSAYTKVSYNFSQKPSQFFTSFLKSIMSDDLQKQFPLIQSSNSIIEVQISTKRSFNQIASKIQNILGKRLVTILHPLKDCQQSLIQYQKQLSTQTYLYFYVVFVGDVRLVIKELREEIKEAGVAFNYVLDWISVGAGLTESEVQIYLDFIYSKFCSIPRVEKTEVSTLSDQKTYKKVTIRFAQFDRHLALLTYFVMQCTRKRPKCSLALDAKKQ